MIKPPIGARICLHNGQELTIRADASASANLPNTIERTKGATLFEGIADLLFTEIQWWIGLYSNEEAERHGLPRNHMAAVRADPSKRFNLITDLRRLSLIQPGNTLFDCLDSNNNVIPLIRLLDIAYFFDPERNQWVNVHEPEESYAAKRAAYRTTTT
jgi:hypothetical protein